MTPISWIGISIWLHQIGQILPGKNINWLDFLRKIFEPNVVEDFKGVLIFENGAASEISDLSPAVF